MDLGYTLRKAREDKGLSTSEVAQRTHMLIQQVEALEKEDFSKIAAPIYGRGFVKLYCEAVGIQDYKPFVDEFMEIYSGNRPATIRMRQTASETIPENKPILNEPILTPEIKEIESAQQPANPILESETSPVQTDDLEAFTLAEKTDITNSDDLNKPDETQETFKSPPESLFDFTLEAEEIKQPPQNKPVSPTPDANSAVEEVEIPHSGFKSQGPSRYSTPRPIEFNKMNWPKIPPVFWRLALLATIAILIVWLIIKGVSALCNATLSDDTQPANNNTPSEVRSPSAENKSDDTSTVKRTPMKLKPLYIDNMN